jgi:hypothetical protein
MGRTEAAERAKASRRVIMGRTPVVVKATALHSQARTPTLREATG